VKRRVLVLFLDGVGLGTDDPSINPFAVAKMAALQRALGGHRLLAAEAPADGPDASLLSIDACLGVPGDPQSATGQAVLLTGRNVPAEIGEHYGPKPNAAIRAILKEGTVFSEVVQRGGDAALLNAYPPRYFELIESGRRLYSSIPFAVSEAGIPLRTADDLQHDAALSADFTGKGWSEQPGFPPVTVMTEPEAGRRLGDLARQLDLSWFDFWPSDVAGHRSKMPEAVDLVERFDGVLAGLIDTWRGTSDLVIITSDHGNLEDLSDRGHTRNPVPALLIGPPDLRAALRPRLSRLTDVHDVVLDVLYG
jgi:2,3-bisphosphoglycerate-independent phosphoglycerate mutase